MATTYEAIATQTLASATTTLSFSSIPSTYTDIILVAKVETLSAGGSLTVRLNNDTGSNYSNTRLYGYSGGAVSDRASNTDYIISWGASTTNPVIYRANFFNYANTSVYKTCILRSDDANYITVASVATWRSTAAISSMQISGVTFPVGSQFTLYGIKAA